MQAHTSHGTTAPQRRRSSRASQRHSSVLGLPQNASGRVSAEFGDYQQSDGGLLDFGYFTDPNGGVAGMPSDAVNDVGFNMYDLPAENNYQFDQDWTNLVDQPYSDPTLIDITNYVHTGPDVIDPRLTDNPHNLLYADPYANPFASGFDPRRASMQLEQNSYVAIPQHPVQDLSYGPPRQYGSPQQAYAPAHGTHPYYSLPPTNAVPEFEKHDVHDYAHSARNKRQRFDSESVDRSRPAKRLRTNSNGSAHSFPSYNSSRSRHSSESRKSGELQHGNRLRNAPPRQSIHNDQMPGIGERPKVDDERPWVRVNATTQGRTTRTSKINNYVARYPDSPLPMGNWRSPNYRFEYTKDGEFKDKVMSARQIWEYIKFYPRNPQETHRPREVDKQWKEGAGLKIWIQNGPTDSARRYKSSTWSKCRFKECPANVYQRGSIMHGHYRVAFDEKWKQYGQDTDPFLVSGYVHLYCLERFCDLDRICRIADVEVDVRSLSREPNGKFAASLGDYREKVIAQDFVALAKHNSLRTMEEFKQYPKGEDYRDGEPKPHKNTLTYRMHIVRNKSRPPAQLRQFKDRGMRNTHITQHCGDLEMYFEGKKPKKAVRGKKAKKRKAPVSEDEESEGEAVNGHATHQEPAHRKSRSQPSPHKRQKRIHELIEEEPELEAYHWQGNDNSDDDDEANYHKQKQAGFRPGIRSSPRKRQEVDYNEDRHLLEPLLHPPPGYQPAQGYSSPQPQVENQPLPEADSLFISETPIQPQGTMQQDFGSPNPQPVIQTSSQGSRHPSLFGWDKDDNIWRMGDNVNLTNEEIEEMFNNFDPQDLTVEMENPELRDILQRRLSSQTNSIVKKRLSSSSSSTRSGGAGGRSASFAAQPVTQTRTFRTQDEPRRVSETESQASQISRRSERLKDKVNNSSLSK